MTAWPRIALGALSLTIIAGVTGVAVAVGPQDPRPWFTITSVAAVVLALQSVIADSREVVPALLLSLPPVVGLVSDGSPTWLIGPMGVLLLIAGELNVLSWECRGRRTVRASIPRRLVQVGQLAALGLGGVLAIELVAELSLVNGMGAVVVGVIALAAFSVVVVRPRELRL